jgi:predicted DsbA family dithiol-disulfide isomerase
VGWKRLDQAVAALSDVADVKITWHAFLLDPRYHRTHPAGEPLDAAMAAKFGPAAAAAIRQRLVAAGAPDGATFEDWQWRPNTMPGHRLVALARRHGRSHEANEALFRRSFQEGKNLSDPEVVLEAGRELGLPGVEEWVRGGEGEAEVEQDAAAGRSE